ncbi:MAG: K(+)-transporting ATPase subunit C [Chitinophagaceae bacterium]
MKKYIFPSIKLTIILLVICSILYPLLISGVAKLSPGEGNGETISVKGRKVGYANIGQNFSKDKYFWGRPSAVNYNAAGSGASNKGASNPDYLKTVQDRLDSFLVHNPGITKNEVPAEMVTASGSGLDPDISPAAAYIQVKRVATTRKLDETNIKKLIEQHVEHSVFGPSKINVLKLNIALDEL